MLRAIAGTALLLAVFIATVLGRGDAQGPVAVAPWFPTLTNGFVVLIAFCVTFLAYGRWRVLRDPVSFWITFAFSGLGIGILFAVLTFPGLLRRPAALAGALPNTAAWISAVALQLVALALLAAALARWPDASSLGPRAARWIVPSWLLLCVAGNVLLVALERHAPTLVDASGAFTPLVAATCGVLLGAETAAGAALSIRRYLRLGDRLVGYVALCQVTLLAVAFLFAVEERRFSPLWVAQRTLAAAGFAVMLVGLLSEYVGLIRRERDTTAGLRESEERLRRAQAIAHVGSWELEVETGRVVWSDEARRIYGIDAQASQASAQAFLDAVHPDDRASVERAFAASLRDGDDAFEIAHRVADGRTGEVRFVRERCEHRRGPSGRVVRSVGMVQDVTERERAERTVRELNESLERRNAELDAERLRLRDADRRKDEFLAMLAHELRNPLAPIRSGLWVLDRAPPGGEQAHRARAAIERQVKHLTRIVGDLLDVSRLTRGRIQLELERLDLREVVARSVEDHRTLFRARAIDLAVDQEREPLWIDGDETRLSQALGNLLENAAKFTPPGGRVRVRAAQEGWFARVTVVDSGVGIPPEMMKWLFEPLTQADRSLDRSSGGLGLGLSLVKGIVELHGGEAHASSAGPDRGAEFALRIPLRADVAAPTRPPTPPARPGKRRVLVIEDNVDTAETLKDALELDHHLVAIAHTGPEGLARAREFSPDVVLCDIGLPGMDGYEVARALRSDDALHRVELIALTGYAGPDDRARAARAGFDHHLAKPPDLDAIERLIAGARQRHDA